MKGVCINRPVMHWGFRGKKWEFYFIFFLIFIFTLFCFTILYWFGYTLTWISHGCTWVPNSEPPSHLPPHIISLDHPRAPAPSILYPVSNTDWRFVSYMIVYMFQCHSPTFLCFKLFSVQLFQSFLKALSDSIESEGDGSKETVIILNISFWSFTLSKSTHWLH